MGNDRRWTDSSTAEIVKAERLAEDGRRLRVSAISSHTPIDEIPLGRENETEEDRRLVMDCARQEAARVFGLQIVETPTAEVDADAPQGVTVEQANETTPEIPQQFKAQYDKLPDEVKARCSWEELSGRLLAKEAHYLKLAMALQDGGELVYIDEQGNPVFRDGGVEPVLKGKSYNKTREILYGADYEEGTSHYGYEMPDSNEELCAIERITGRPFITSKNRDEYRATHMESGENPSRSRYARFRPRGGDVRVFGDFFPYDVYPWLGLVRLLRVKKMA